MRQQPTNRHHASWKLRARRRDVGISWRALFAFFALLAIACDAAGAAPSQGRIPPCSELPDVSFLSPSHTEPRAEIDFDTARAFPVSHDLEAVAVGDFDGDGAPDVALADLRRGVLILLGRGDGTFLPPARFPAGMYPQSIVAGDFDGDRHLDLAVLGWGSLSVLLGKGDGTFQAPRIHPISERSNSSSRRGGSIAVGDFDGDHHLDVVVAGTSSLLLLRGKGDGTLEEPRRVPLDVPAYSIHAGDFDGDGRLDVLVGSIVPLALRVLPGRGDGTFGEPRRTEVGGDGYAHAAVGDFDGDRVLDVALATTFRGVYMLLGKGDGTFVSAGRRASGSFPQAVAAADVDLDRRLDLVVVRDEGVEVLLGDGHGALQAPWSFPGNISFRDVAVTDFDGDGRPDLAVVTGSDLIVPLGNGDGTFRVARAFRTGRGPEGAVAVDMNGDGILDIVTADRYGGSEHHGDVSVLLGRGGGAFLAPRSYPAGDNASAVAAGDFDGDGVPDVVVENDFKGTLHVLLGRGDGTLGAARRLALHGGTGPIVTGDFDGDGRLDIAAGSELENEVEVLLGNGDGTFQAPIASPTGSFVRGLVSADLDGDGNLDLAAAGTTAGKAIVLLGNGDGTFQAPAGRDIGGVAERIVAGDLDGDGLLDLAVSFWARDGDRGVSVLLGRGGGAFAEPARYVGFFSGALAAGDFDGDGVLDLAAGGYDHLTTLVGRGDGTFRVGPSFGGFAGPYPLLAADFDGDGRLDVAVTGLGDVSVLRNVTSCPAHREGGRAAVNAGWVRPSRPGCPVHRREVQMNIPRLVQLDEPAATRPSLHPRRTP